MSEQSIHITPESHPEIWQMLHPPLEAELQETYRQQVQELSQEQTAIALAVVGLWLGQAGAIGDAIERADTGYLLPDSFCEALVAFAHRTGATAVQQKAVTACDLLISHLKGA